VNNGVVCWCFLADVRLSVVDVVLVVVPMISRRRLALVAVEGVRFVDVGERCCAVECG